jgi:hypothetical protein
MQDALTAMRAAALPALLPHFGTPLVQVLVDDAMVASWIREGLPSDPTSVQNGAWVYARGRCNAFRNISSVHRVHGAARSWSPHCLRSLEACDLQPCPCRRP